MKIVNGYICDCTTDERYAKRGIDPENPQDNPVKAEQLAVARGEDIGARSVSGSQSGTLDPDRRANSVLFENSAFELGGRLSAVNLTKGDERDSPLIDIKA